MQLTNAQKKAARQIINISLQRDYRKALAEVETIVGRWRNEELSDRDAYMKLYQTVKRSDKTIARRYNGISGSQYIIALVGLFMEGLITADDLDILGDELKKFIIDKAEFLKND